MSIILDALNKSNDGKKPAQSQGDSSIEPISTTSHSGVFMPNKTTNSSPVSSGANPKKRIVILIAFLTIAALAVVTFFNFRKPPTLATAPKSTIQITPEIQSKINEAKKKKKTVVQEVQENLDEDKSEQELEINRLKNSAALHFQSDELDMSAKDYDKLINLDPTNPETRNNYGLVLKKLGKKNEAKDQYSLALALKEDYPEALNNMAIMYITDNNLIEAKQLLKKAIELNPDYLDPYLHLALCLEKNGEVMLAKQYYQMFLKKSEGKVDRKIRLQIENRLAKLNES